MPLYSCSKCIFVCATQRKHVPQPRQRTRYHCLSLFSQCSQHLNTHDCLYIITHTERLVGNLGFLEARDSAPVIYAFCSLKHCPLFRLSEQVKLYPSLCQPLTQGGRCRILKYPEHVPYQLIKARMGWAYVTHQGIMTPAAICLFLLQGSLISDMLHPTGSFSCSL